MRLIKIILTFCTSILLLMPNGFARDLSYIDKILNPALLQGSGRLNWWGFHIYDASFYRAGAPSSQEFAIDIRYQKSFTGVAIANSSKRLKTGSCTRQANGSSSGCGCGFLNPISNYKSH